MMSITKGQIRKRIVAGLEKAPKVAGDWGWQLFGVHITGEDDGLGELWWLHGIDGLIEDEGVEATQLQAKSAAVDSMAEHFAEVLEFFGVLVEEQVTVDGAAPSCPACGEPMRITNPLRAECVCGKVMTGVSHG